MTDLVMGPGAWSRLRAVSRAASRARAVGDAGAGFRVRQATPTYGTTEKRQACEMLGCAEYCPGVSSKANDGLHWAWLLVAGGGGALTAGLIVHAHHATKRGRR